MSRKKKDRRVPAVKQLLRFFKRPPPDQPSHSSKEHPSHKRDFDRFPLAFRVAVAFQNKTGERVYDEAELKDISGNGAMFITLIPEQYYPGQGLELTIFLAGPKDVRASIRTEGSVVRIRQLKDGHENDARLKGGIAVRFDKPFEFERMAGPSEG